MANLVQKINQGKDDSIAISINTIGLRAIYNYLGKDEVLTIACEEAIQRTKKDGFRENIQKQDEINEAIYEIVQDEEKTVYIYKIIENNKDDY